MTSCWSPRRSLVPSVESNMVGMLLYFWLHILLFIFHFSSINPLDLVDTCKTDNKRTFSAWNWIVKTTKNNTYSINLCKKADNCNDGVSICNNNTDVSYGSSIKPKVALPTLKYGKYGFSITFNATSDQPTKCDKNKYQSQINFHCDKILGFPEIVEETECLLIFEFFTNEACENKPTETEIPCSLFSPTDGLRRDFSPLIKQTGGHLVSSSERGVEVYINVCRDITNNPKIPASACSKGNAACRIEKNIAIGQITKDTKLRFVDDKDKVTLSYTMPKTTKGCQPRTTITFICPKDFSDAGIGPVLISSTSSCQYEIEWRTDYACPDRDILTNNCTFTNGIVSFDLAQLKKPNKKESYGVNAKGYIYRIKVCSNGQPCGSDTEGKNTAVCQINPKDPSHLQDKSCGDANNRKVRYADGTLTLIYKNGKSCHNGIHRTTIIDFRCDPKVDVGAPTFSAEEHCHYFFEWRTRHVCPSRKPGTCSVMTMVNKKQATYDLSVLTKTGENWLALNDHKETAGYMYYINVCGAVTTAYTECHGAAVCEVHQGNARGIGNYDNPPGVSPSGDLILNYTGGECVGFGRGILTVIKFICTYKNMENPPELESKSWDGCEYVFTWKTAAACSLHVASGKDCVLEDPITGYVFDLSDLKKGPRGNSKPNYFTVHAGKATFNIAVCGSLGKAACGNRGTKIGVCKKTGSDFTNAGLGNANLYYYDGKMNLTYSEGGKCSRGNTALSTHITFFCRENIKIGKPEFEKEDYCTYHFIWYTSFACPSKGVECLAKDDKGREYDLSSLVKTDSNWITHDKAGRTYYINVCRVVHHGEPASKACPGTSAVCMKNSTGSYNIGDVTGRPTASNKGVVSLTYQAGKSGKCRTIITFLCPERETKSGPVFVDVDETECIYKFQWQTRAACAVEPLAAAAACGANDMRITQLTKPQCYSVEGPSFTIQFNICKNITCGSDKSSTVCLIDNKGKKHSLGRSPHSTIENRGDVIVLTYPNGYYIDKKAWGLYAITVINFICARNVTVGKPVFSRQENNVYTIDFQTSVACPASEIQCSIYDTSSKTRYDLSPLKLATGNWMAADTRTHLDYYINICKAFNPAGLSPSCSGAVGGCQLDKKNSKAHSMGLVRSEPFLSSTGDLTLRYTGGEKCHTVFYRSTRLNFFCSTVHGSPVYMTETEECEYVFNWKTPSACPLVEKTGNERCEVYDSVYGVRYDLGGLRSLERKLTLGTGDVLRVGFCGATPKKCNGFAACLQNKDGNITRSFHNSNMTYYNDAITIKHISKDCNITSKINCGRQDLSEGVSPSNHDGSVCNIEVDWYSKLACRPLRGEECSLTYNHLLYDLSVLAKENWNWRARVAVAGADYSADQFYISVCKPLEPLINDTSPPGLRNGSRLAVVDSSGKVISLGTMVQPLSVNNGFLTMTYGDGESFLGCESPVVHIQFVCDSVPEGVAGEPVLDGFDKAQCILHFTWVTKAACHVRSPVLPARTCVAIHPATMKSIDLNKLYKKNGYTLKDQHGETYKLSVCQAASKGKGCPALVGMCKKVSDTKYQSVGQLNKTLVYRQGFLYLVYKDGDECSARPGYKMETLISFICDRTGNEQPKLERTSDCTHYVTWKTHLACEAEVECVASNGKTLYDLSPLIRNNGNYETFSNGKRYFINVCRSLASEQGCSSQAAVCAFSEQLGKREVSDLGHVTSPPVVVDEKGSSHGVKVRLVYSGGSCKQKDGKTTATNTTIEFVCDQNEGLGEPGSVIPDEDGCSGRIMWRTSLVCEPETFESKSCIFHDPKKRYCFDLTKLSSGSIVNVKIPGGDANFDVCGSGDKMPAGCKDSEVCVIKDGEYILSKKDTRTIQYSGREVRINYDNALIIIYCGENTKSEGPQYIGEFLEEDKSTKYVFNWVSQLVCPPREPLCIIEDEKSTYDLGILTKQTGSYYLVDRNNHGDRYRINICGNVPTNLTSMCSSRITAWRNTSKGVVEVIGKDTEQKIGLKPDDNFPIQLNYTSDTAIKDCGNKNPSVMHKFKCASVTLPPFLERFDKTHCLFIFVWRTSGACAEKRTSMKLNGDWIFYDARNSFCDLDLGILRQKISRVNQTKDCDLGTPSLYSEGGVFELEVTCRRSRNKLPPLTIHINIHCDGQRTNSTLFFDDYNSQSKVYLSWETDRVCNEVRFHSCSNSKISVGKKAAQAVIGTLLAIGILAAIIFFACKPEKRDSAVLWIRWHVRKYICCKPSYQASYRYKKVSTGDNDDETDFIIEANVGTVFSSDEDDDNDDDLLPLDDDLLNLDEA